MRVLFTFLPGTGSLRPLLPVAQALRARGHEVPSSCETGTCGTCKTKMLSGEADHRDLFLAPHERKDNIMTCVSRALSDEIVLDR